MKLKNLIPAIVFPVALCTFAEPYTVKDFKASRPLSLPLPQMPDSALAGKNSFDKSELLSAREAALRSQLQNWTAMAADTAGFLRLANAKDVPALHSLSSRIRASRFAKGKLSISSTSMADVLLNGVSVLKKTTSDSTATSQDAPITLNPETDYDIQVNILSLPDDKSEPQFKLEFIPDDHFSDVEIKSGADIRKRFNLDQTSLGKRASGAYLSPDGKYVILRYSEMFDANNRSSHTVMLETATGNIVSANIPDDADWMPTGSQIYHAVAEGNLFDVYTIDVPSMKSTLIAEKISTNSITWAPDAEWFAYYKKVDGIADQGPLKRVQSPDDRIPGHRDRWYLRKYDPKNRISTPLTYGGPDTYLMSISPDSKKLVYSVNIETPSEYPFYKNSIIELDMATLKTDTLFTVPSSVSSAIYSPDGKRLFVVSGPSAFGEIGVNAGKHPIPNDFDNQGYIFDIASKTAKPMTRDFDPSLHGGYTWNEKDGKIYFIGEEGFDNPIFSLDPVSGNITKIMTELPAVYSLSMGENSDEWLAYVAQGFNNTGAAYMLNLKSGETRLLSDTMQDYLSDVEFGKIEPWKFKSEKGDIIDGIMCLPPEFDPTKKYPLIVYYYGGTAPSAAGMTSPYSPQVFASRDYVVYVLNPSGTTGYGQEFSARHVNAWGKLTADEIIEGVKKFCKEHSFVDSDKIGCLGASYGGFMTQYLLTKTDIFTAAVSHAGISNVTSYWGEGFWGYSYNSVAAAKSYPWNNPKLFTEQGSLFNADKIHTPLLLLHGTVDTNVPIGESIQIFNALRILGRDVEFITVEDQNHIITDFEKRKIWQASIMAWFAKWLQDDPRWWESMYGN